MLRLLDSSMTQLSNVKANDKRDVNLIDDSNKYPFTTTCIGARKGPSPRALPFGKHCAGYIVMHGYRFG